MSPHRFGHHVLLVGQRGQELVQAWAWDSWDLLDQRLRAKDSTLLGQLHILFEFFLQRPMSLWGVH